MRHNALLVAALKNFAVLWVAALKILQNLIQNPAVTPHMLKIIIKQLS